jgi:hypothetical protein
VTSPSAHILHLSQLRDLVDGKTFSRGERYHKERRVSKLERDGSTVRATVAGIASYQVTLWVKGDRIAFLCSCPVGQEGAFCKHCVAVVLTYLEEEAKKGPSSAPPQPEASTAPPPTSLPNPKAASPPPAAPIAKAKPSPKPAASPPPPPVAPSVAPPSSRRVCKPPDPLPESSALALFLAGSIEMGKATPWQARVAEALAAVDDLTIFNPRRDAWDSSWEQSVDDPRFRGQVDWELDGLERAHVIAMYFEPSTRSPITLLELGLYARSGKLIVCCPAGFWRKGNVDVVCRRHGVHQTHDLAELIQATRARLTALTQARG